MVFPDGIKMIRRDFIRLYFACKLNKGIKPAMPVIPEMEMPHWPV